MFKEHEMGVELQRRDKLKKMNERERIKAEEEYQKEMEERRKQKMPHPVGHCFSLLIRIDSVSSPSGQ